MASRQDELRTEITNKIVESLKKGSIPWRRPWSLSPNAGAQTNLVSGKAYRGINAAVLLPRHQIEHGLGTTAAPPAFSALYLPAL